MRSAAALALLVPVPSAGAWAAFYGLRGSSGQALYFAAKIWIAALPLVWLRGVERDLLSFSPLRRDDRRAGLTTGLVLGALMSAAVLLTWLWLGERLIDVETLRTALQETGLTSTTRYVAFALYLTLVNSLVEEYVWRWFVFRRCEDMLGGASAVLVSALFFTLHHVIAFHAQFGATTAALASGAVFGAGCLWSACYLRFRSIWPGWISHALVDATALALGWRILLMQ